MNDIIRKYASTKTAEEIGVILGKSERQVRYYAGKKRISLKKTGENHKGAKLSNLQVQMLKALLASGFTASDIHRACFSHVHLSTVSDVKSLTTRYQDA